VKELERHLWDFAASESCGTCTPCREGTALRDDSYLDLMEQASLCPFGRNVPRAIRSLRRVAGTS
jgi:formate dehydrogenase iron-sulfur subunit